jgi:hypothetical protein
MSMLVHVIYSMVYGTYSFGFGSVNQVGQKGRQIEIHTIIIIIIMNLISVSIF